MISALWNKEKKQYNYVQIVRDSTDKSPLHYMMEKQDANSTNIMLKFLANYGVDHHSQVIYDLIPDLVDQEIPALPEYLASRMLETK